MDREARNAIERATQQARTLLEEDFASQLEGVFDVLRDGHIAPKGGPHLSPRQAFQRDRIVAAIEHKRAAGMPPSDAVIDYLRDAAFTTFNRFIALKMLETRQLVQECITKGEQSSGYRELCGLAPGVALLPDSDGYRLYLEALFDELSTEVKVLFDRRDTASVLWPKRATFEALLEGLNATDLSGVWAEDETIGWVYQFFNSKEERAVLRDPKQGGSHAPRNSRELAVRNQFFTPRYVVEFLVDNTLGRTWIEMHGERSGLVQRCRYFVRTKGERTSVRQRKDPRDLRMLDPACGSGHFLLYCFDLLLTIYEDAWAAEGPFPRSQETGRTLRDDYEDLGSLRRAAPVLIVEHNLYGVDIDPRCAQIAALALWLRAQRALGDVGLSRAERPLVRRTHIVVAEPMPGDDALVEEFASQLDPPLLRNLFKKMVGEMRLAGELGSLIRVEEAVAAEIHRARELFVARQKEFDKGYLPGLEPTRKQGELDISGIDDDGFFHEAEADIVEALRQFADTSAGSASARRRLFAGDSAQGVALIDLLRTRFDAVLMNPPFGAASLGGKKEFEKAYPRTKNDIYAAFVERGISLLHPRGLLGAITSRTGFFLSSFQKWREEVLLKEAPPVVFADLGYGVMDAAMVEAAAYCLERGR
jgi:Eco57I restriction-modification methylase